MVTSPVDAAVMHHLVRAKRAFARWHWPQLTLALFAGLGACRQHHSELPPLPKASPQGFSLVASDTAMRVTLQEGEQAVHLWSIGRLPADGYHGDDAGYCIRIEDESGRVIDSAGPASCPDDLGEDRPGAKPSLGAGAIAARNALVSRAALVLAAQSATGPGQAALRHLQQHAGSLRADIARIESEAGKQAVETARGGLEHASLVQANVFPKPATAAPGLRAVTQTPVLGVVGDYLARHRSPSERVENAELEFTQEVHLFSKKVRQYLIAGKVGDLDHTATILLVKSRPRQSNEPWQLFRREVTRNHGTIATDPSMEAYAICSDLPVTDGWFAWKGECPGTWGDDHTCNDDTRLQIWHAYGQWSDENFCKDTFQANRPSCRNPW